MESRIHREVYVRFGGGVFLIEHPSLWISDTGRRRDHYVCTGDLNIDYGIRDIQKPDRGTDQKRAVPLPERRNVF